MGSVVQDPAKDAGIIRIIHRTMPDIHRMRIIPCRMHILRHRIATFDKESNHRGAPRPCGARPKAAPLLSLLNLVIFQAWGLILGIIQIIPAYFVYFLIFFFWYCLF